MFAKITVSLLLTSTSLVSTTDSSSSNNIPPSNIVFITLDDVGIGDISIFGSEWFTPNLDKFVHNPSTLHMSSHYNGYTDSASRSQILTRIYSWHAGYGKMGSSFGPSTIGGIPQSIPTMAEYFKSLGNYNTYYIGAWGLGHSIHEHTPTARGFDYFYGSYGMNTNVLTKTQTLITEATDPSIISSDNIPYFDFWENEDSVDITQAQMSDSNTQYIQKLNNIINSHNLKNSKNINKNVDHSRLIKHSDKYSQKQPFLAFLSLQGSSQYLSSNYQYNQNINDQCQSLHLEDEGRYNTCQFMLHLDHQFGLLFESLKHIWDDTLIIITSDNGGSLTSGSCNYPLRGGKGSYFEGSTRSLALIGGGGLLIRSKAGLINSLDGLMSNVDWIPTLLSLTNIIPSDWTKIYNLDGYNMHSYIYGNSLPIRDHIIFDLEMFGTEKYGKEEYYDLRGWAWTLKNINDNSKQYMTLTGLSMVFYNHNGNIIKYFVSSRNDEINDNDIDKEYNWCIRGNHNNNNDDQLTDITTFTTGNLRPFSGLYDLTKDPSEQRNLLRSITKKDFEDIKEIIMEKTDFYMNNIYNEKSKHLYDSFECFYKPYNSIAYAKSTESGKLSYLFDDSNEWIETMRKECGLEMYHPVLEMHRNKVFEVKVEDNSHVTKVVNNRASAVMGKKWNKKNEIKKLTKKSVENNVKIVEKIGMDVMDENNVYSSCVGLDDGRYYVQLNFDETKPVLNVMCSNGYMLIDYSTDNNWKEYFSSWTQFHWQVASPFKSDYADMTNWFLPDASSSSSYNYLLSFDCNTCLEDSLVQTEGLSTTYWQSTVPNFCGDADKGVNGADEMWDYQCRTAVFSKGYYSQELIDIWPMTDENGIDRDILLTKLSAKSSSSHIGICSSLKKSKDYSNFNSQLECATGTGGEMPVVGTQGKYCICTKEQDFSHRLSQISEDIGHTSYIAQKRLITNAEQSKLNINLLKPQSKVYGGKNKQNADSNRIVYMHADDFKSGTYRIQTSGTYILLDDIIFDYNAPDYENNPNYSANEFDPITGDMHWYPKQSQKETYPGAYDYRDPYHLGFFAGITIEVDNVIIDLNGHSIKMDERYFFQQPFWSHIQLGNSNFIPGKGPSPLIIDPIFVNNIEIKNGILGLTSHHCIHGTSPKHSFMTNIKIENIICKDFTTHGIQLNGFNGLIIENVEVGPTTTKHLLTSDYSNMRTLLPRFKYFADLFGNTKKFKFGGKPSEEYLKINNIPFEQVSLNNKDEYTLNDILDEAIEQMDMAYDYVTGRKTENELYNEYGLQWLQSKRVFVYNEQNGIPYGGSLYGVYLNYPGTGITGFYTNNEVSKNVNINNLYIHDLIHGTVETPCVTDKFKSIFGVAVSAQKLLGDNNYNNYDKINIIKENNEMYYYGTIVYDMFIAFYDIVSKDLNNIDVLNLGVIETNSINWVKTGKYQNEMEWSVTCGNDPMFHAVKGLYGLRMSGINNAKISNIKIENIKEISNIGSNMCGTFIVFSQQQPYMYGYSGNNVHSISVLHSNVLFNNININNIESYTGNSTAISIYPRSNVKFEGNMNEIKNIIAGKQFLNKNIGYKELLNKLGTWPNPIPRGCGVKTDDFGVLEGLVSNIGSLGDIDGTKMNVKCIRGYFDCNENTVYMSNDNKENIWSDFGMVEMGNECIYNMVDINDINNKKGEMSNVDNLNKALTNKYNTNTVVTSVVLVIAALVVCLSVFYLKMFECVKDRAIWEGYQRL